MNIEKMDIVELYALRAEGERQQFAYSAAGELILAQLVGSTLRRIDRQIDYIIENWR